MTTVGVPPVPLTSPIVDPRTGVVTPIWKGWFQQAFLRLGGHVALTNLELEAAGSSVATPLVAGLVSTTAQELGGVKTFADGIICSEKLVESVVELTDAATIAVDASLGNVFDVTLGDNRTMGNPTNAPADGYTQKIIFRVKQDGTGSRTLAWDTDYRFSTDLASPTLTTTAGATDLIGFVYHQDDGKWDCVALNQGFT